MSRRKIIVVPPQQPWPGQAKATFKFWIPGEPRPWQRAIPTKNFGMMREGPDNRARQEHVYNHVACQLQRDYAEYLLFLPLMRPGAVVMSPTFYFPTGDYNRPMTEDPDCDNLFKNIGDALSGCLIKKPTLLYQNDSQIINWMGGGKQYWNPSRAMSDRDYPQEVGTLLIVFMNFQIPT